MASLVANADSGKEVSSVCQEASRSSWKVLVGKWTWLEMYCHQRLWSIRKQVHFPLHSIQESQVCMNAEMQNHVSGSSISILTISSSKIHI